MSPTIPQTSRYSGINDLRQLDELIAEVKELREKQEAREAIANTYAYGERLGTLKIPNNAFTLIPIDTVVADPGKHMSGGVFVVPVTGTYLISGQAAVLNIPSGKIVICSIFVTGAEAIRGTRVSQGITTEPGNSVAVGLFALEAGKEVQLTVYQDSGAEQELELSSAENRLSIMRIA